jgi:two-component sensor histidine kinase
VTPEAAEDQLLLDRIRLGGTIILAGVGAVFVGELILRGGERPAVSAIQAVNIIVIAIVLGLARSPARPRTNLLLAFLGAAVTTVCTGGVGIVARDPLTTVIVIIAIALGAATIVPWGPWWQLLTVVVSTATAVWSVSSVVEFPAGFWLQDVGSVVPTLAGTVLVAHVLRRQRIQVMCAEHERNTREVSLRAAKETLEREIEGHRRTEERLQFALCELDHRVKNTLATVQSVAQHTLESSQSQAEFGEAFQGRIQSMARIHSALAARKTDSLGMRELIALAVDPYDANGDRVEVTCDGCDVASDLVRPLSMALHELATNAAKYGALSTSTGCVIVSSWTDEGTDPCLHVVWQELHGPRVITPARRGLGSKLIEDALVYESGGTVTLRFAPSGVRCEIDIPLPRTVAETAEA